MRQRYLPAFAFLLSAALADPSHASVLGGLESYAKDPVKGILDDAEKKAESLIQQGQNVANGLISHAGIELDATVQSANQGLGANINKTVEQLGVGEQQVLLSVLGVEKTSQSLLDRAYDLRDTTMVDLTEWQRGWVFAHAPDFLLKSIQGTALLPQPGDYHLTMTAVGLGISSDYESEITATLDGKPLQLSEVDQVSKDASAILSIPNAALAPLFAADALKVVTVTLDVAVTRKHFLGSHTNTYPIPVHLLLYPAKVATVTVHVTSPTYGWVPAGEALSAQVSTGDADGCRYCKEGCTTKNNTDVVVPASGSTPPAVGDERITAGYLQCFSGSICAFNARQAITPAIPAGTGVSRIHGYWETCSHPMTWQLHGVVQKYLATGAQTTDQKFDLLVDHPQTLSLPDGSPLITIDVTAFTKQSYTFVAQVSEDPHNIVNIARQMGSPYLVVSAVPPLNKY